MAGHCQTFLKMVPLLRSGCSLIKWERRKGRSERERRKLLNARLLVYARPCSRWFALVMSFSLCRDPMKATEIPVAHIRKGRLQKAGAHARMLEAVDPDVKARLVGAQSLLC